MLNSIKSLTVVLIFLLPILYFSVRPMSAFVCRIEDYKRRCLLMVILTAASFLAVDFWIFCVLALVAVRRVAARDQSPIAVYWMILLAVAPVSRILPLGGIGNIFAVDYFKILALAILLPEALRLHRERRAANLGAERWIPRLVAGYFLFKVLLFYDHFNVTSILRDAVTFALDFWLPCYVMSYGLRDVDRVKEVLASFTLAVIVAGALAIPESIKHWSFYMVVRDSLGIYDWLFLTLTRGDVFRAQGTTGQPIVLACALSVGLGFWLALQSSLKGARLRLLTLMPIVLGLIATFSRGPWVGAVAMIVAYGVLSEKRGRLFAKWGGILALVVSGLLLSPYSDTVISYMPFAEKNVDTGSAEYRQRLLDISLNILGHYPFFGTPYYLSYMEELRQGQGIIDLVNTYLVIALPTGYVGLALWLSPILIVLYRLATVSLSKKVSCGPTLRVLSVGVLSSLLGLLVSIGTVSPLGVIPILLWGLVGIGASIYHIADVVESQSALPDGA